MSFIKDMIESPHYIYNRYFPYWNFLLQSYEGGVDYTNSSVNTSSGFWSVDLWKIFANGKEIQKEIAGNLFQHKKERADDYNKRIQMSFYYNFCAPIIDIYTNHLFKHPVIDNWGNLQDIIEDVNQDIDLKGSSIGEFRKQMAELCQIHGHCFVLVDSPKIKETEIITRLDQIEKRAYPYLMLYSPQCIINWSLDAFGNPHWVLLREFEESNSDYSKYDKNVKSRCKYKLWTKDSWYLYDNQYNQIDEGFHGLGLVPIVCVFNKQSKKVVNYLGISSIADIAFINRDIYNSCSELKQILRDQTFAILALQGNSKDYDELSVGTSKALLYPPETNQPAYISPPGDNARVYFDHINIQVSKIYQLAKLEGGSASFKGQDVVTQSGVSKAWDFNETNSSLSDKANNLEDAENKIWKIFANWLGMDTFEGAIQYPKEFSIQSLMEDLTEAEKSSRLLLGKTFDIEIRKAIHKKKFPSKSEKDLEAMGKEVEQELGIQNKNFQVENILNRVPSLTGFRPR